ncbi:MAG TPA: hypothetical protein VGZ01_07455 [Trinickia sp.]|nr:hypothetical protein [Trinickia sp.]
MLTLLTLLILLILLILLTLLAFAHRGTHFATQRREHLGRHLKPGQRALTRIEAGRVRLVLYMPLRIVIRKKTRTMTVVFRPAFTAGISHRLCQLSWLALLERNRSPRRTLARIGRSRACAPFGLGRA